MALDERLRKRASVWAGQITKKANTYLGRYKPLISVKSTTSATKDGKIDIISTATATDLTKPVARAYEYGSGIHSRVRSKKSKRQQADGTILITPKNKRVLAFFWEKVNENTPAGKKFIGISETTGKALMRYVEHPGVRAANGGRGYLGPAVNDVRKQMRKEVPKEVRDEVVGTFRKAFKKR